MSGVLHFEAHGAAPFDNPVYEVEGTVADLFIADEGVGPVSAKLVVKDNVLTFERLNAASSRLLVFGSGSIAMNDAYDSDLLFRFQETSLDPYLHLVAPSYSTYTPMIVSGSMQVRGPLADWTHLLVDMTLDSTQIRLFEYELTNDGPIRLTFEDNMFKIGRLHLKGKDTALELSGQIDAARKTAQLAARGDASLSILQLFFPTVQASGAAGLSAQLTGPLSAPQLSGQARLSDGRLRYFGVEHSLDAINGTITFDGTGVNVDGLRRAARRRPAHLRRRDRARRLHARPVQPHRHRPVDAAPLSRGIHHHGQYRSHAHGIPRGRRRHRRRHRRAADVVRRHVREREPARADDEHDGRRRCRTRGAVHGEFAVGVPIRFNIGVHMNAQTVIQSKTARVDASIPDLRILGTADRLVLNGRIEIEGGEMNFSANRYWIRPSSIDFSNPTRTVPVFDLEVYIASARAGPDLRGHGAGHGYDGQHQADRPVRPWLSDADIVSLLLGAAPAPGTAEQRSLAPQQSQERMFEALIAQLMLSR
jgi:hypothetical protein